MARHFIALAAAAICSWLNPSAGYAALTYEIGFGQTTYDATVGTPVELEVYFREFSDDAGDVPRLADNGPTGLASTGITVNYSDSSGGDGATYNGFSLNTDSGFFANSNTGSTGNPEETFITATAQDQNGRGIELSSATYSSGDNRTYEVLIGTVTFTDNTAGGSTTTIDLAEYQTNYNVFAPNDGSDVVTPLTFGTTELVSSEATAVPEPSSMAVLAATMFGGVGIRRWRHRKLQAVPTE